MSQRTMTSQHNTFFTILSVDDSESDREIIYIMINRLGNTVLLQAESCAEATKILEREVPDLLLLDINMHKVNGLDYLEVIRKNPRLDKMPVCIYSTSSYPEDINAAFEKKANRYIVKPATLAGTMELLKRVIEYNWSENFYCTREEFVLKASSEPSKY